MAAVLKRITEQRIPRAARPQRLPNGNRPGMKLHGGKEALFPMEALLVSRLAEGNGWRYEPRWDGFRCLAEKRDKTVTLRSTSTRKDKRRLKPLRIALRWRTLTRVPPSAYMRIYLV
jgi:hypothetical protein